MTLFGQRKKWFREYITPNHIQASSIEEIIYKGKSKYQKVQLFRTGNFGRCLVLDGKIQSAESDEFVYHESLVHPPLLTHPNPRNVFIAGGGEGATAREVLAHRTVERVVMIDIDQQVVELCKKHLPNHHMGAFDDKRLDLRFTDALAFLANSPETYDALVLDLPDPVEGGPAYLLYTQNFYRLILSKMNANGVAVIQAGSCSPPTLFNEAFTAIHRTMSTIFPNQLSAYRASVPSFGGLWGFLMVSLGDNPRGISSDEIDRRIDQRISSELRFYDGETHAGAFHLPKYLRGAIEAETRIITEENPVFVF